jgi:hypothetical protein
MAESSIFTTWGAVHVGRESMGLGVFQEAIASYTGAVQAGKLADFRVGICENGNLGKLAGYVVAEGSVEQIQAIWADEAYQRIVAKGDPRRLVLDGHLRDRRGGRRRGRAAARRAPGARDHLSARS